MSSLHSISGLAYTDYQINVQLRSSWLVSNFLEIGEQTPERSRQEHTRVDRSACSVFFCSACRLCHSSCRSCVVVIDGVAIDRWSRSLIVSHDLLRLESRGGHKGVSKQKPYNGCDVKETRAAQ